MSRRKKQTPELAIPVPVPTAVAPVWVQPSGSEASPVELSPDAPVRDIWEDAKTGQKNVRMASTLSPTQWIEYWDGNQWEEAQVLHEPRRITVSVVAEVCFTSWGPDQDDEALLGEAKTHINYGMRNVGLALKSVEPLVKKSR